MSSQSKLSSFFATASTCTTSSSDNLLGKRSVNSAASLEATTDEDNATESSDDENDTDHSDCDHGDRSGDITKDLERRIASKCTSACCSDDISCPVHPTLGSKVAKRKQGKQSRSLCSSWFSEYPWLTYCTTKRKVFCFYCRKAYKTKVLTFSKKSDQAFIGIGYDNWKKAKARFKSHQRSHTHTEAIVKLKVTEQPSVISQLVSSSLRDKEQRRKMQLSSLRYLARQGLAVRGHKDEEGNLFQLLKCRATVVHGVDEWLKSGKYLSHDIINELVEIMALNLLRNLLTEIRQSQWFALISDETRDQSGLEQLCISIRWVDQSYTVSEDIIGMMEMQQTDALTISNALKDVLLRCSLPLRGQAYDGASNMAGHLNGVAVRLQREEPRAHYVHCLAHSLNLCLQECSCKCSAVRDALGVTQELYNLIRASPKRLGLFNRIKNEIAPSSPGLKPLCPTRWTVRTSAIDSVVKNYLVIDTELEEIADECHGEPSRKASGLRAVLEKFQTYFGLRLASVIFSATEQLSTTLQGRSINMQEAISAAETTKMFLNRQRSDSAFTSFYDSVVKDAQAFTNEPTVPRKQGHLYASPSVYYRKQYFEVLDLLVAEISRRFDQPVFIIMQEIETLLLKSCAAQPVKPSTALQAMYKDDINFNTLEFQLKMLPDLIETANKQQQMGIKKVTSINTICDIFNSCTFAKTMLCEVHKIMKIYLTVPVTSATAERSFSTLRRVKNYLRTTMTEKRLNHLILLHSHKHRTDEVSVVEVAKEFSLRNDRRKEFFGNF